MKKIFKAAVGITPVFLALALFCSNPAKDVQWRSSVDLPITANKKFLLGAMMDTIFFNKKQVQTTTTYDTIKRPGLPDSIAVASIDTTMMILKAYPLYDTAAKKQIPDTVAFGFPSEKDTTYSITKDTMKDKYYSNAFGPIPLSGTPEETLAVPLTGPYVAGAVVAIPAVPVTVKWVYEIDLMDSGQTLNVTVANNSSTDFSTAQITLGSLGTSTINNLAPNSTGIAQFNANGKVINGTTPVSMAITPATGGAFAAGDNLQVMFSLDGLTARKVDVTDYLLANYQRTFTNEYNLTDTVSVDYIDIAEGFFIYSVSNYTGIDLLLTVIHRNLWTSSFCQMQTPPLDSVGGLTGLTSQDSLIASNCVIATRASFPPHTTNTYDKHNISQNRLFPEWDPADSQSVTKIDYLVNVGSYGREVVLSAGDSLSFVIKTTAFKFTDMYGTCMIPYQRTSNLSTIPVNLPWSKAVTDSLRGHFILQQVLAKVRTNIGIPPGAFIDTVHVAYEVASVTDPTIKSDSAMVLNHVTNDSVYYRSIDITKVVNNYPDSINVKVALTVDSGTAIRLVNDLTNPTDPDYPKYIGRMILHGHFNYNLVAPLWWTVADTTIMDLGGTKVDLSGGSGLLNTINDMTDRHATFNVKVTNFTNVYLRLYALATTDSSKIGPLVDTTNAAYINTNQFNDLINQPTTGFFDLLGNGLLIPPRDSNTAIENTITLTDQELGQISGAKTMGWRWEVRFIPQPAGGIAPDALLNTDWLKLNSWIHVDGVNSIDSLFSVK